MRPDALLLDLDGTLVDSEPLQRSAYEAYFAHRRWDVPDLLIFTGRRAEDVFATVPGPWSHEDPAEVHAGVVSFFPTDAVPTEIPGARELVLAAARASVPMAIVTSAGPAWVRRAVGGALDVLSHVAVVVTSEDVSAGKPDPEGFSLACRLLGVDAARALGVEDSPAGVRAAVAAGVGEVAGVSTTHDAAVLFDAGATVVHPDLRALVERLSP